MEDLIQVHSRTKNRFVLNKTLSRLNMNYQNRQSQKSNLNSLKVNHKINRPNHHSLKMDQMSHHKSQRQSLKFKLKKQFIHLNII